MHTRDFEALPQAIDFFAKTRKDHTVLRFFADGENETASLTYGELQSACLSIARNLQPYSGQRAVLLYAPGLDFLCAFFACLYAGVVAVPAYPPRKNHNLNRLLAILYDAQPAVILSTAQQMDATRETCLESFSEQQRQLPWLTTDMPDITRSGDFQSRVKGSDIAFLQYSSGSTGDPKGIMVTHANLMANIEMAERHYGLKPDAHCISWLPLFHDMGLIGAVMMPICFGTGTILMPPQAFLQKPVRFLHLVTRFGKHFPVGATQPDFAYQLLTDHVSEEELSDLDLSAWDFAMTGAEPIKAKTLRTFAGKFSSAGFNADAFRPAYGMAECTLLSTCRHNSPVTQKKFNAKSLLANRLEEIKENPTASQELVSAGTNCSPQMLRIVSPDTRHCLDDGHIGEIWLKGPHIAKGYWGNDQLTKRAFHAYTSEEEGPYLRTGDLGGMLDGELFVTGRLKDLIIIRGKNHYPQDLEATAAEASNAVVRGNIAAFSITVNHQEQPVLVCEVERSQRQQLNADEEAGIIRQRVLEKHGLDLHAIAFIRFNSLSKTSSGKIQRFLTKEQFLDGKLKHHAIWTNPARQVGFQPAVAFHTLSQTALSETLLHGFLEITGDTEKLTPSTPLDSLGLDSIEWFKLIADIEKWTGKTLDATDVFQLRTLEDLTLYLAQQPEVTEEPPGEIEGFI